MKTTGSFLCGAVVGYWVSVAAWTLSWIHVCGWACARSEVASYYVHLRH